MTETTQQLARKLADHPRFRWLRGTRGLRWTPGHTDHLREEFSSNGETDDRPALFGSVPDLDDPATIGCVEAQVREMRPDLRFACRQDASTFWIEWHDPGCNPEVSAVISRRGAVWATVFLEVVK